MFFSALIPLRNSAKTQVICAIMQNYQNHCYLPEKLYAKSHHFENVRRWVFNGENTKKDQRRQCVGRTDGSMSRNALINSVLRARDKVRSRTDAHVDIVAAPPLRDVMITSKRQPPVSAPPEGLWRLFRTRCTFPLATWIVFGPFHRT